MVHYYARLDAGVVQELLVVADDVVESKSGLNEIAGSKLLMSLYGGATSDFVRCSVDGDFRGGISVGWIYDKDIDSFISPQPFESWTLNDETYTWEPPVPMPEDGDFYWWNEAQGVWVKVNNEVE